MCLTQLFVFATFKYKDKAEKLYKLGKSLSDLSPGPAACDFPTLGNEPRKLKAFPRDNDYKLRRFMASLTPHQFHADCGQRPGVELRTEHAESICPIALCISAFITFFLCFSARIYSEPSEILTFHKCSFFEIMIEINTNRL